MASKDYWTKREAEHQRKRIRDEKAYNAEIRKIYENMADIATKEINGFYSRYASKEGITLAEAKRRISTADIAEYAKKAEKYVPAKDLSDKANEEMRLYNAMMSINRLEMLKSSIGLGIVDGFDELDQTMREHLTDAAEEEFVRQAGILGGTVRNPREAASTIVNSSFHNATFSQRIWMHQGMLRSELDKVLQEGLIKGENSLKLARHIQNVFGASRKDAERLMRTEMSRIYTEAQKESYDAAGYEDYTYIALGDACEICAPLDGKHFKVKQMRVGENAPPMHPNCRCSTAPWMDRDNNREDLKPSAGILENEETLDYMARVKDRLREATPFGEITIKQYKVYTHEIWTESNDRASRRTAQVIDDIVATAKAKMPQNAIVPRIVIVNDKRFSDRQYGGYDYKTDTIYFPNRYENKEAIIDFLKTGYFGGTSEDTLVLHEVGHKEHWDQAKRLYNGNPKRYNTIEDAKHSLDESRRSALVKKQYEDPMFIVVNVSENADEGLSCRKTLNEFQADLFVRRCHNSVSDELLDFLEDIENDALT